MAGRQRPTLRDVARLAGLSVTQTSRALNGHSDVAAATRERARAAAEQVGYLPNLEARRLKVPGTRAQSLGMVLAVSQRFSDPFLGDLLTTMVDEAASRGYEVQLSAPLPAEEPIRSYARAIQGKRVDGFVVLRTRLDDVRVGYLAERRFPCVTFGRVEGPMGVPAVAEAEDGLLPAVQHLADLGHRRIGCLVEPADYSVGAGRHRSFLLAMAQCGLAVHERLVVGCGFRADTAFAAAGRVLDDRDPPTAFLASNDLLAMGALRAAAIRGIDVPGQLSVIGFDDISPAQFSSPPLTTMRHADGIIGRQLVTQLIRVIEGGADVDDVLVRPELVVRESTGPPSSRG